MIIAIQGYNGKKNKAVMTTAAFAAMLAMTTSETTLVLQFINRDIDCIEGMYTPGNKDGGIFGDVREADFSEEGMDPLMRYVDSTKIMKQDFETMCVAMLKAENLLDVAPVSNSSSFVSTLTNKEASIEFLLDNAKEVYTHIILLAPTFKDVRSDDAKVAKILNELADKSIYCVRQGHTQKAPAVYGKNIVYVATDFEQDSEFTLSRLKKQYNTSTEYTLLPKKRIPVYKISHNVGCNDAAMSGKLLRFVRSNRQNDITDINHTWSTDIKTLIKAVTGSKEEEDFTWEKEKIPSQGILEKKLKRKKGETDVIE